MSAHLVLASASPQRRAVLERLGVAFVVQPSEVAELERGEPEEVALENALRKARAVLAARRGGAELAARGREAEPAARPEAEPAQTGRRCSASTRSWRSGARSTASPPTRRRRGRPCWR